MMYVPFSSRINLRPEETCNVQLVFQMTVRMATCRELAEDKQAIQNLRKYYFDMEQSNTPVSVLLPWFPGPARKVKKKATRDLYCLIQKYVTLRREAKVPSSDPIDFLITNGDSNEIIISVSALNLFYGQLLGPF
jgi:sterol 14-demethylase